MLYLQGLLELLGFKMPLYKPSQIFFFTNKNKQNFSYKGVNSSENNPCNSCKKVKKALPTWAHSCCGICRRCWDSCAKIVFVGVQ